MIDYREERDSNVVELTIDGKVSKAEFEALAARLEAAIKRHGHIRLLEVVRSFGGVEPAMFWHDLRFSMRHLNDFSRCAVVAEQGWLGWVTKIFAPLFTDRVRHFTPDQVDQARAWLRAADDRDASRPG